MQKKRSKKLMFARTMPPLYHTQPGKEYNWQNSDVLKWLAARLALVEFIFETIKNKEIIYNSGTGKWQGIDYDVRQ